MPNDACSATVHQWRFAFKIGVTAPLHEASELSLGIMTIVPHFGQPHLPSRVPRVRLPSLPSALYLRLLPRGNAVPLGSRATRELRSGNLSSFGGRRRRTPFV